MPTIDAIADARRKQAVKYAIYQRVVALIGNHGTITNDTGVHNSVGTRMVYEVFGSQVTIKREGIMVFHGSLIHKDAPPQIKCFVPGAWLELFERDEAEARTAFEREQTRKEALRIDELRKAFGITDLEMQATALPHAVEVPTLILPTGRKA